MKKQALYKILAIIVLSMSFFLFDLLNDLDNPLSFAQDQLLAAGYSPKTYVLSPVAAGITVYSNAKAIIDASNASQGYIMAKYIGSAGKVKLQIKGSNNNTYTYDLYKGKSFEAFPLTSGNGSYSAKIFENVGGNRYALALGENIKVEMSNGLLPYLYSNQYVSFTANSLAVQKAAILASKAPSELAVVERVYDYVVGNIKYDYAKAKSVKKGYLPNLDATMKTKKGICFDYASLMSAMLRSQGIPARLEIGYVGGTSYHAWISVYLKDKGWVDSMIYFDGAKWTLMDPTIASSNKANVKKIISKKTNYQVKYSY